MKAIPLSERRPCTVGVTSGRWLVVNVDGRVAKCRCECGTVRDVPTKQIRLGLTKSCGCLTREIQRSANTTHGESMNTTKEYRAWRFMIKRCHEPTYARFVDYGGRSIAVCVAWRSSYEKFLEDIGRAPSPSHSIDRIDNDGDYEPGNVRWATRLEQAKNKRTTVFVSHDGVRRPLVDVADAVGISRTTVRWRRLNGWPTDKLFVPPYKHYATTRRVTV